MAKNAIFASAQRFESEKFGMCQEGRCPQLTTMHILRRIMQRDISDREESWAYPKLNKADKDQRGLRVNRAFAFSDEINHVP